MTIERLAIGVVGIAFSVDQIVDLFPEIRDHRMIAAGRFLAVDCHAVGFGNGCIDPFALAARKQLRQRVERGRQLAMTFDRAGVFEPVDPLAHGVVVMGEAVEEKFQKGFFLAGDVNDGSAAVFDRPGFEPVGRFLRAWSPQRLVDRHRHQAFENRGDGADAFVLHQVDAAQEGRFFGFETARLAANAARAAAVVENQQFVRVEAARVTFAAIVAAAFDQADRQVRNLDHRAREEGRRGLVRVEAFISDAAKQLPKEFDQGGLA